MAQLWLCASAVLAENATIDVIEQIAVPTTFIVLFIVLLLG
jgi:hypothetical protein